MNLICQFPSNFAHTKKVGQSLGGWDTSFFVACGLWTSKLGPVDQSLLM